MPPASGDSERDRLATLSRRLDDAESEARKLRAEWNDTLDRLNRIVGRIAKRAARDLEALDRPEPQEPPVNGSNEGDALDRILRIRRRR